MKKWIKIFTFICFICLISSCKKGAEQYELKILYDGLEATYTVSADEDISKYLLTNEREGYTFLGWFEEDNLFNASTIKANTTLTAKWEKKSYEIKFIVDDETITKTYLYDEEIIAPEVEDVKDDNDPAYEYKFAGWNPSVPSKAKANGEYSAVYNKQAKQYICQILNSKGQVYHQELSTYFYEPQEENIPTKASTNKYEYIFKEWQKDIDVENLKITFTPVYEETLRKYTYKFFDDDGTILKQETINYGEIIVAPTVSDKEDNEYTYIFSGWNKNFNKIVSDIVITAKYDKVSKYLNINFKDGDELIESKRILRGSAIGTLPDDLVCTDGSKEFLGWYVNGSQVTTTWVPTEDTNVSAKWQMINVGLEGKKISFIGDSISTFYAEGSVMNSYYGGDNQFYYPRYSSTVKTVEKTWWYQLLDQTKTVLGVNNSLSGSCACGSGWGAGSSDTRINTLDENGTPDIVIVYLGTNDNGSSYSASAFKTAMDTICTKVSNKFSGVEIFLITLGYTAYTGSNYTEAKRLEFNQAMLELANTYDNVNLINWDEYCTVDNYYKLLGDNLHYNAIGAKFLGDVCTVALSNFYNVETEVVVEKPVAGEPMTEFTLSKYNGNFWTDYETDIFVFSKASATSPIYSDRIYIKQQADGNYDIVYIASNGDSYNSSELDYEYVIIISSAYYNYGEISFILKKITTNNTVQIVGDITSGTAVAKIIQ